MPTAPGGSAAASAAQDSDASASLRAELSKLQNSPWYQLSALQKHGAAVGVSSQKLAEATNSTSPKEELVTLILQATDGGK